MVLRLLNTAPLTAAASASDTTDDTIHYTAEQLFLTHKLALYRYLVRLIKSEDDAQDLLQECYIRLRHQSETKAKLTRSYLFTIALNLARDRGRRAISHSEHLHEPLDSTELTGSQLTPDEELLWHQGMQRIRDALNELPERTRRIFLLRRFRNVSAQDIAGLLGLSKRTVERELVAAMDHCREKIKDLL